LSVSDRIKTTSGDGGKHSLTISKVENSDGGKYTVRAFNDFGESRFTATILVRGQSMGAFNGVQPHRNEFVPVINA